MAEAEGLAPKQLDPAAIDCLRRYPWPGNVRELENLIRRLAALYSQEIIGLEDLRREIEDAPIGDPTLSAASESLAAAVERHLTDYFSAHEDGLPAAGLYERVLHEIERPLIELSLKAARGNQIKTAKLLGLNRNTLRKKIRALDIPVVRGLK